MPPRRRLKICLAASGGGHLRQLLDLAPAWGPHDAFFVTEDTALSRSLAETHRTHYVAHVALGQGRLGAPLKMVLAGVRNCLQSWRVIWRERPDVIVTTGAGSVFFSVLWSRLLGAEVVVIESFARFERLSAFAKICGPIAHHKVLQSQVLQRFWPNARVFDPMRVLDTPPPPKRGLLFATVGATLPFDRLTRAVATLKQSGAIAEDVVIQTGVGGYRPDGIETYETLPFDAMLSRLKEADIVVCHGGTGSLITALRQGCKVVAMPRLFKNGEHYDDHQAEITDAFAARGLIEVVCRDQDFPAALDRARARRPVTATSDPAALIGYLQTLLGDGAARSGSQGLPEVRSERAARSKDLEPTVVLRYRPPSRE